MSFAGNGIGITRGIAIGEAHILQRGMLEITPRSIEQPEIPFEIERFRDAVCCARDRLQSVRQKIPESTRSDIVAFIDTHLLMLNDAALIQAPIDLIKQHAYAAEWALQLQKEALVQVFDTMDDPYLRTRKDDVEHVVNQIQKALHEQGEETDGDLTGKVILAQDLTPADTIVMRHQGITAFITEFGGPMSHTAILARSLGIPAVVGVHSITRLLRQGEVLVVDGEHGVVLADVDRRTLDHYRRHIHTAADQATQRLSLIGKPATTKEGVRVSLMANIELPEDIESTRVLKADAVGLYRTEFLYMNRQGMPDEEEHYRTYRKVIEGLDGIPITIRTLDLGADKQVDGCTAASCNPALGLRAIRLCLKEPKIFQPQIRAILRAAIHGPVRIMIPMLSNLQEVRKLKAIIAETKRQLAEEGLPYADHIPIGGMIEVPAAALSADAFSKELDFLSIGTNDLIQYTLAIDRVDDEVNYLYDPLHPAILRLIQTVIEAGKAADIPVSMCGEMAGDPRYIPLLVGMGLREFSMQPGSLLIAKECLFSLSAEKLSKQTRKLMKKLGSSKHERLLDKICRLH
ncbi:phosphoenolpyruvate--protein phosphotransferase [Sedimenticola selenatireducens]|uniref:Phosphoenolpyruvate-protein phosphotransferase n=1 Tax=Sedimenticola selenatireducens TaxID=191960 RepID=A0A558DXN9_9GAMM|nr:phosphoenolpyruvate--protein phosphotransferase [Sedimenticola selenatireducens]TVO70921.1 phosphoenolpyruvate--protein phosphotransferase [Sedimenticola selenatireducens]TVT65787.1 MAG: phosphoenolpyruvate--protein phosphotransferase [Sedimenticola selenatireducens]